MFIHFGVLESCEEFVYEGKAMLWGMLDISLRVVTVLLIGENLWTMDCLRGPGRALKSGGHFRLLVGVCLLREHSCQLLKV